MRLSFAPKDPRRTCRSNDLKQRGLDVAMGVSALFGGVALFAYILTGVPLRLGLAITGAFLILSVCVVWRVATPLIRRRLVISVRLGLLSGIPATLAYNVSRFLISRSGDSPYNPFETIRVFGLLLAGPTLPEPIIRATGAAFHLLNGISFAVAYCLFCSVPRVATGIAWALLLEAVQLMLYPRWLGIQFSREFVQISAVSHIVYGATLGFCARYAFPATRRGGLP